MNNVPAVYSMYFLLLSGCDANNFTKFAYENESIQTTIKAIYFH